MSQNDRKIDEATGQEIKSHEWDGIAELDTPLPRWWLWTFYITIVWGVIYTIAYPAWPRISSATAGVLGYSSRGEVAEAIAAHEESNAFIIARTGNASFEEINADADLDSFAKAGGAAVFRTYCSQCHGAGAAGAKGYPNLIDDDWLWGGSADAIAASVRHGIRWEFDDDTRYSEMPAFGRDEILTADEIELVADYVLSLSGRGEASDDGATLYADNCAACHGDAGLGDPEQGAPNLADAIWLYGADRDTVIETITYSRFGVMPSWSERLTEAQIRQVAHYVHTLGGGE
ncbi:MAG: cytochrome-c oxidase, cbb3-type subunit III [Pseudomonadota bacterium]